MLLHCSTFLFGNRSIRAGFNGAQGVPASGFLPSEGFPPTRGFIFIAPNTPDDYRSYMKELNRSFV